MAAPTSNNEVTARRLTRLLTGSDGNGGLWGKIKTLVGEKQSKYDCSTYCTGTAGWFKVASVPAQITTSNINAIFEVLTHSNASPTYGTLYINVRLNAAGALPGATTFQYVKNTKSDLEFTNAKIRTVGTGKDVTVELWINPGIYRAVTLSLNKSTSDLYSRDFVWTFYSGEATSAEPTADAANNVQVFPVTKQSTTDASWINSGSFGNITSGGALQTSDITIANGDKLVVTDASDSNKIARTSVAFDGSTTTTALTPKGTFETFSKLTIGTTSTTAAAGNHTHSSITTVGDKRNVAPAFSDYSNKLVFQGLKTNTVLNTPYSGYSYLVGLRGWSDASGGKTHELAFSDSGVFHRTGDASSYGTWSEVLTERYTGNKSNFRTIPQDMSKGANLVVNGQGLMMNNYNWPDFTYDGVTCYNGSSGTFYKSGSSNGVRASTEFISVDCTRRIVFSADVKYTGWTADKYVYLCALVYDIDKKEIMDVHTMYGAGTLTTLAQALNPGDTKVYLTSVANWSTSISQTYTRGFIFWNYTNSLGYTYPPETYSRNVYSNWFDSASDIDTTNNTITLNKAWTGPAIPAGTSVSKCADGGNYLYVSSRNITVAQNGTWFTLKGSIKGFVTTGNNPTQFRQGTAFVKPGFLFYGTTGTEFRFTNYKVYEVPEDAENAVTATKIVNNISAGSATNLLYGTVAGSDYYRVRAGGDSNNAWFEIATADDGTEPIYIRQYTGAFATVTRTATILDGSGNTSFPGNVTATKFIGALQGNADTATSATSATSATNATNATYVTTTADTSNTLYVVGVTSTATTTLKRDTSVTINGGTVTATKFDGTASRLLGTYSGSGGQLAPSAITKGSVRAAMMNNPKGLTLFPSGYCDCLLLDTYTGTDVPNVTGFGLHRTSGTPRMFIFNGTQGSETGWNNGVEVLTTASTLSASKISGTLPVAQGGTGQTSLANVTVGTADKPTGFTARSDSITWGTLTAANGYTSRTQWTTAVSGAIGFADKNHETYMQIDGYFYQNEGQYRVLDTSSTIDAAKVSGTVAAATTADSLHTYSLGVSDSKPWRKVLSVTGLGTWNSAAVVLRVFNRGYAVQSNLATYYGTVVFRIYRGNDTDSYPTYRDLFVDNGMFADPSISGWNACIVWTSNNDAELWLHCNANSSSVCYAVEYSNNCTVGDPIGDALSSSEMTTYLSGKSYKNPTYSVAYNGTYQYMTVGNATTATKLGSSTLGSGTKPIYLSSGTATECSTYAGGTAVTLNNSSKAASTASFYAPTAGGTANYVLIGNGTTSAPTWAEKAPKATTADTATKATQDSDGNAINATYFKSSGNVTLVSNTATKIGTQNGADVKLTLPSIPAAVSVKGNAESSYRTGQVNLTPANLGISATTSSVTVGSTTFNNTDTKVTQTNTDTSSNAQYRLLMSATADDTTRTEGARKSTYAWFNPSTQTLGSQKFNVAGAAVIEYSSTTDTVDIKFN